MSQEDFDKYGDISIEDTGYGFKVVPDSMKDDEGGCGGCGGGCGH